MVQKNIRNFNGAEFSVAEAAEWHKEFNDRTRSSQNGYNSIDELATKLKALEITANTLNIKDIEGLQTALNSKENTFNKNTAFNKNFGTTAGTVAQGNDNRINNGQIAFNKKVNAIAITGDINKVLTITLQDGSTLTESFTDIDTDTDTNVFLNGLNFNKNNGTFTAVLNDSESSSVNLDGRYALLDHNHDDSYYTKSESDSRFMTNSSSFLRSDTHDVADGLIEFSNSVKIRTFDGLIDDWSDWGKAGFIRTNGKDDGIGNTMPALMIWCSHSNSNQSGNYGFGIGSDYGSNGNSASLWHYMRNSDGSVSYKTRILTESTARIRRDTANGTAPFYIIQQGDGDLARFYQGSGDGTLKSRILNNGNYAIGTTIYENGTINSVNSSFNFLNGNRALPINTNELLVSNDYTHRSLVPTNGMYVRGDISMGSGRIRRHSHVAGFLEGSYNNVGSNGAKTNPIYIIGSNYIPYENTLNKMYGIGYSYGKEASFINSTGLGGVSSSSIDGWGMYVAADGHARIFLNASGGHGLFYGHVYANQGVFRGNVTANSDKRLKSNIKNIPNALEKVLRLNGCTWDRKDMELSQAGIIAQELEKVLPVAVTKDEDGMLSVDSSNAIPALLIEAIKELKTIIDGITK